MSTQRDAERSASDRVAGAFAARLQRLTGTNSERNGLAAARADQFARFAKAGLPNRRLESWHFTDLRARVRDVFPEVGQALASGTGESAAAGGPAPVPGYRLLFVDGAFRPEFSDGPAPAGVRLRALSEVLADEGERALDRLAPAGLTEDPMVALNAALMTDGLVIEIEAGVRVDRPLNLVWLNAATAPASIHARSFVSLGAGARATLTEGAEGDPAARQINAALVVSLADEARLDHVWTPPQLADGSFCVSSLLASLGAHARLTAAGLVMNCPFARRQTFVRFDGPHGEAQLVGLSLLRGEEHADNTLVVTHVAPHCRSRELFKHIVDESGRGVFQGKVVVAPGAQKTDGVMASRAVLLSEDAGMDNKPELEIFADDVVCGHGATCGELDREQLFYAMARGMPRSAAEALLLEAFAQEALETIADESMRDALAKQARVWLEQRV